SISSPYKANSQRSVLLLIKSKVARDTHQLFPSRPHNEVKARLNPSFGSRRVLRDSQDVEGRVRCRGRRASVAAGGVRFGLAHRWSVLECLESNGRASQRVQAGGKTVKADEVVGRWGRAVTNPSAAV
ncbi:hypothetical protein RTBOTA2_006561, partial [Rhodotorula toruloides]